MEDHGGGDQGARTTFDEEFISGWGSGNAVSDDDLASWLGTVGAHRQVYMFGTCYGGGMMDELEIETGDWRFGCAAAVHFEQSWTFYTTPSDYTSFSIEFVDAAAEDDRHTTASMFQYAYANDDCATDGMGAPWGQGIFYTEGVEHPYAVGDNLDLKPSYWMGDGTPEGDATAGSGPDTDWSDPDNWNDEHIPLGNGTGRVRFYGEGGRAFVSSGLHTVGALIVDYGMDVGLEVGGLPTGMHLNGTGGIMSRYTTVGCEERGYFAQSQNSTHDVEIELTLGRRQYSQGEYCLWDGLLRVPGSITVGDAGHGVLDIRGGYVQAGRINVGVTGNGEVHHRGGDVRPLPGGTLDITIGSGDFGVGQYTMYPGTALLEATNITIGGVSVSNGTFTQQGGAVAVTGELAVGGGTAIYGGYLMEGGLLTVNRGYVGKESGSRGEFTQSGGTVRCLGDFDVGGENLTTGALRITDGTFDIRDHQLRIGVKKTDGEGVGTFILEGGLVIANRLRVSTTRDSYIQGGDVTGGTLRVNHFPTLGGYVDININLELGHAGGDAASTYTVLAGDTFAIGGDLTIAYDAPGEFIHQNGDTPVVIGGDLKIGARIGSIGTYSLLPLNGSLESSNVIVGYGGSGTFLQTGGYITVADHVILGWSGAAVGQYELDNSFSRVTASGMTVGRLGEGTFLHLHGTVDLTDGDLVLAEFSTADGTYELSSGSLRASAEYVGMRGKGVFLQTGGTTTIAGGLVLGQCEGSFGTYEIWDGQLHVQSLTVGESGMGSFVQFSGQAIEGDGPEVFVTGQLMIGLTSSAESSSYEMWGGRLQADRINVGGTGVGSLTVGDGTVTADTIDVTNGDLSIYDGTVIADSLHVHSGASFNLTGPGGVLRVNSFSGIEPVGWTGSLHLGHPGGSGQATHAVTDSRPVAIGGYFIVDGQMTVGELHAGVFGPGKVFLRGGQFEVQDMAYVGSGGGEGGIYVDKGSMDVAGQLVIQPLTSESSNRGKLFYYLYGTAAGTDYGQVVGTQAVGENPAMLGGTLVADFTNYAPHTGDTFILLDSFDISGTFDAVAIRGLEAGFQYDVDYTGRRVTLEALSDGVIDEAVSSTFMVGISGVGGSCGTEGGVDARFGSTGGGRMITEYRRRTFNNMRDELPEITDYEPAGESQGQYWDLSYDGTFTGLVEVTLEYDESLLGDGYDETQLGVYHHNGAEWEMLDILDRDVHANRLTVLTDSFSPMVLIIEPDTPGDTNGDDIVDEWDYDNLVAQFGGPPGVESADFNEDGRVDLIDLAILRRNFGEGVEPLSPGAAAPATPEPATLILLAGGLPLLLKRRKRSVVE